MSNTSLKLYTAPDLTARPSHEYNRVVAIESDQVYLADQTLVAPPEPYEVNHLTVPPWFTLRLLGFYARHMTSPSAEEDEYNCHSFAAEMRLGGCTPYNDAFDIAYEVARQGALPSYKEPLGTQYVFARQSPGSRISHPTDALHSVVRLGASRHILHVLEYKGGLGFDEFSYAAPAYNCDPLVRIYASDTPGFPVP